MRTSSNRWWVRHRPWSWGSTPEEVAGPFPYPDLVPEGKRSPTMAVTINATPEEVWPWLVQLGWNRGGWYSWDLLDNGGRPSATKVHPEWQDIDIGDLLKFRAMGRDIDAYKIGVIEPNSYLGLYGYTTLGGRWLDPNEPRPPSYMEAIWGFLLKGLPDGRTRLVGWSAIGPFVAAVGRGSVLGRPNAGASVSVSGWPQGPDAGRRVVVIPPAPWCGRGCRG
jgi:hypothetical protein